jgi:hypothetical protein
MIISANKWEHDVQGYLNICNISDSTPRQQIRDFAKGVNDLGLWNSMVCWPLRSSQNYGSGTTAYSLGGLGSFNGVLTNGPSWGGDGVLFAGSAANFMVFPSTTLAYPFCFSSAVISPANGDANAGIGGSAAGNLSVALNPFETIVGIAGVSNNLFTDFAAFNTPSQALLMNSRVTSNTSVFLSAKGGNETAFTATSAAFDVALLDRLFSRRIESRIAFALITSGASISNAALYTLYKDTLGQGLTGL